MQKITFEWLSMLKKVKKQISRGDLTVAERVGRPFSPPFGLDCNQSSAFFPHLLCWFLFYLL
jgi:hypothetical protein